ncbi:dipeptidase PepV [Caloranaerobacter azorensis]|uniref:Dipeptidase PepV n=1 Tax=Caloranaerobacter azorensis TaxID=116090 RepID=A0A6P1YGA0_9FIRM|nr:dipeptidase PepV [Caloranaerobacter azorensis]QIB27225.1 dipeptidase PepV [Caloranaerobacter azorensis]
MNFEKIIDSYKDDIIKSTQELIRIKSVEGEPKPGMPFGEGPNEALEYALRLAESMGFETLNVDGYAGHADLGEGEEVVGVLVHLDVVPEGDGWTYPPYVAEIHDGKIYGRGAIDDKGPTIASLYAMKAIKESGVKLNKKIRIIFGTNEESGWGGINYYLKKVKAPNLAFTPDADFPVIHGEMGILIFNIEKKFERKCNCAVKINYIKGGNRPNMVPDYCEALLEVADEKKEFVKEKLDKFVEKTGYKLSLDDRGKHVIIKSYGISAHGSTPQAGKNAISQLIAFLGEVVECDCDASEFVKLYNRKIGMEYNGQSIGCGFEDSVSGKLVFNVGVIDMNEEEVKVSVNIRYPIKYKREDIYNGMEEELKGTGVRIVHIEHLPPIYIPSEDTLVQKLMSVYREFTGDYDSKPITIGGGTYARAMKNAVAFGPLFPGQEELAHQKDEYIAVDDLIKITKLYAKALYELAR